MIRKEVFFPSYYSRSLSSCSLFDTEEKTKSNTPENQQKAEEPQKFDYYPLVYEGPQIICINYGFIYQVNNKHRFSVFFLGQSRISLDLYIYPLLHLLRKRRCILLHPLDH